MHADQKWMRMGECATRMCMDTKSKTDLFRVTYKVHTKSARISVTAGRGYDF